MRIAYNSRIRSFSYVDDAIDEKVNRRIASDNKVLAAGKGKTMLKYALINGAVGAGAGALGASAGTLAARKEKPGWNRLGKNALIGAGVGAGIGAGIGTLGGYLEHRRVSRMSDEDRRNQYRKNEVYRIVDPDNTQLTEEERYRLYKLLGEQNANRR